MFRNLLITLLLAFSIHNSNAQFVTLSDPDFINCLNNQGYGSCLSGPSGNLLDTTCVPIVMAPYLSCDNFGIHDLNGIQYFDHLIGLSCSSNPLVTLPPLPLTLKYLTVNCPQLIALPILPPALEYLRCSGVLTSLPSLPSTLKELNCSYNQLSVLPPLPSGLEKLDIGLNQFTVAPVLPNGLKEFNCEMNQLTVLSVLPDSLLTLYCNNNFLSALPVLPAELNILNCSYNQILSLPSLSAALQILECDHNQLTAIPTLPPNLNLLECSYNLITSLPSLPLALTILDCNYNLINVLPSLPIDLQELYCSDNQLTSLPALTSMLEKLNCSNNQLTSLLSLPASLKFLSIGQNAGIKCLPYIKELQTFYWDLTGITCLPNAITVSGSCIPSLASYPICDMWNENSCSYYWNISGQTFSDQSSDCIDNIQEEQFKNIKILLYTNGNLVQQTYTNNFGQYIFDLDTGTYIYTTDTSSIYTVSCPASGIRTSVLTSADSLDYDMDFALECKPGFDVGVSSVVRTSGVFRPGNIASVKVMAGDVSNHSGLHCATGISGTVQVVINGPASYQNILPGTLIPS
ncbi:MAG: leucine-rich repeat domain-containing protein, partial [Bacteroidota bacterium]